MMDMNSGRVRRAIECLIEQNDENIVYNSYDEGHLDGYHDALIDLLNKLNIAHNHEYYNN